MHFSNGVKQETQLMLTNPRDAFRGQSRSPNMASFDMLGMVSYWRSVVPKTPFETFDL